MRSGSGPVPATLPKVFIASAEFRAAERDDGVRALDAPVHASPFEPGPDRHFAASLQDAGGRAETLGVKFRVAHASAIAKDVERALDRLGRGSGMGAKRVDDGVQFASIQFRASLRRPCLACAGCTEDGLTGSVQSLLGVEPIENRS